MTTKGALMKVDLANDEPTKELKGDGIKPFPNEWLIMFDCDILERLAIMTVDGGLSDEEALEYVMSRKRMENNLFEGGGGYGNRRTSKELNPEIEGRAKEF